MERLKEAWPGLTISDRAFLLIVLLADSSKEKMALRWSHHRRQLMDLALADTDPYVRYLAARDVRAPFRFRGADESPDYVADKARFEKVRSDSSMLVLFSGEDGGLPEPADPELFWSRPHVDRLILVNGVKESGETIAGLLRYAAKEMLPSGRLPLEEMLDVLLQYVGGKTIAERVADTEEYASRHYDGWADYSVGKSVKALWEVIPDIPLPLSYVLIDCLPGQAGLESGIPPQVVESLNERQLERLLWRDDIALKDLRRKLYKESTSDSLRRAAVTSQRFELSDSDISELVYDPEESEESGKKKVDELALLAENCKGATLVQLQAICGLISDAPSNFHAGLGKYDAIGSGEMWQTWRAKQLSSSSLEYEVLDMRLYTLAKHVAPIKADSTQIELPEKLKKYQDLVVAHNPWQTYLNLKKVVRLDRWQQTIGYLPEVDIRDFDLPETVAKDTDGDQDHKPLFDLLQDVQNKVSDVSEKDRAELHALGSALLTISDQVQNAGAGAVNRIEALHARITDLSGKTNILFWLIGALLLLILFKIR